MVVKQLNLFSFEKDLEIDDVISKVRDYDSNLKVAAVYLPSPEAFRAEPSFAVKENGKYKLFQILHGHVLFRNSPLDICDDLPNKWWIRLNG